MFDLGSHFVSCDFLNQARAGCRLARTWFIRIVSVRMYACVCVCVSAPEAINN